MAVQCSDFLDVSDHLVASSPDLEIYHRAALGRAYYSLFHEARIKADELNLPVGSASSGVGEHKRLVARYQAGGKRLKVIGGMLDKVRAIRTRVDYALGSSYTSQDASKDIKMCRTIIAEIVSIDVVVRKEN